MTEPKAFVAEYYGSDTNEAMTTSSFEQYGALYNFPAVEQWDLCPVGWHVPSRDNWLALWGGEGSTGGRFKSTGTIEEGNGLWYAPNDCAENASNFNARPGGYFAASGSGFIAVGSLAFFHSSTINTIYDKPFVTNFLHNTCYASNSGRSRAHGFSVRCIKNTE